MASLPLARSLLLAGGLAATAAALLVAAVPWDRIERNAIDMLVVLAAIALLAEVPARLLRWPRALSLLAVGLGGPAIAYAGLPGLLATSLLLAAGLAVGDLLRLPALASPWARVIAGLGVVAAVAGWLLPFPVHFAAVWFLALAALVAWRRHAVWAQLRDAGHALAEARRAAPRASIAAAGLLCLASLPAWLPIRMSDDLGYHLGLIWSLLDFGHSRFEVGTQVWTLAPWSTDVLHGLVSVLAGGETTGPLNVFWLAAATWLVRELSLGLGLSPRLAWLSALLYASLPVSVAMTGGLQVEAASPAMLAALARVIQRGGRCDDPATLRLCAVLAGLMMGAKASHALLLLPLLTWLLVRWRGLPPLRALPMPALLFLFVAGSSYAYAWALTGNPVLPLFNHVFASPWFTREAFVDPLWQTGWDARLPWRLVVDTPRYYEAVPGAAGVVTLALLGGLAGLADRRLRPLLLAGLAGALLMFWQVQYLRYVHPALALVIPALVAALVPAPSRWKEAALAALVAVQLLLAPTANWMHLWGAVRFHVGKGADEVLLRFVPERLLARRVRDLALPGDRVLYADREHTYPAELPGRAFGHNWYNPRLSGQVDAGGGGDWARLVDASGANLLVARDADADPALSAFLVQRQASVLAEAGPARLYRLAPDWKPMLPAGGAPDRGHRAVPRGDTDLLGEAELVFGCTQPGKTVVVEWRLSRADANAISYTDRVDCGPDGKGRSGVSLALPGTAGERALAVSARPADGQRLSVEQARVAWRQDLLADAALYRRTWDWTCGREGCKRDEAWIVPVR